MVPPAVTNTPYSSEELRIVQHPVAFFSTSQAMLIGIPHDKNRVSVYERTAGQAYYDNDPTTRCSPRTSTQSYSNLDSASQLFPLINFKHF